MKFITLVAAIAFATPALADRQFAPREWTLVEVELRGAVMALPTLMTKVACTTAAKSIKAEVPAFRAHCINMTTGEVLGFQ